MVDVVLRYILDTKVIDDKGEGYGSGFVCPQSRCVGAFVVAEWRKFAAEALVGENAGLR